MSYTQLHAATSMLHWIFTSTSRDTVFSCTQWDHRNPGTGTQAPNAARKGSPGPTRHRRILGRQNPWVGRILRRFDGHDVAVRACIVRVPQEVSRALAFAVVFSSRVSGIHFIEVSFLQRIAIILYGLPYPWVVRDSCGYAFRNWSVLSHTRPGSAACSHS